MPERRDHVRTEISAYIDGETDACATDLIEAHLRSCSSCRGYEASMRAVKRAVRLQPAVAVPDLRETVMQRVALEAPLLGKRRERGRLMRVAAVAATVTVLFLGGIGTLLRRTPADIARATEISVSIQTAARSLHTYRATYEIEERGWHPDIGTRRFETEIWYDAPERFRLRIRDLTTYPSDAWPINDVEVVSTPRRWSITEPSTCPPHALPDCGYPGGTEVRTLTQRQPFDGTTSLPTDIVLPLQTLASSDRFSVLGVENISGREAYKLALDYADARPIIDAVEAGGSWRDFSPEAVVEMWIERDTWFPLSLTVTELGHSSPDLEIRATSFTEPSIPSRTFHIDQSGIVRSGGFHEADVDIPHEPSYTSGLEAYRSGRVGSGAVVISYARGMSWLKLIYSRGGDLSAAEPEASERIEIGDGVGYYQAANGSLRRTLDLLAPGSRLRIETNLDRARLIRVARSTGFIGRAAPLPEGVVAADVEDIEGLDFAKLPAYLPDGYDVSAAYTTEGDVDSAVVYYRRAEAEYDGIGVRVTQVDRVGNLPPSSETFELVRMGSIEARWSVERGELEWIEGNTYRSVAAPSLGLAEAERIARSLR